MMFVLRGNASSPSNTCGKSLSECGNSLGGGMFNVLLSRALLKPHPAKMPPSLFRPSAPISKYVNLELNNCVDQAKGSKFVRRVFEVLKFPIVAFDTLGIAVADLLTFLQHLC